MPPVALPFPVSAMPGRRPGEGQGDLINVFARKVGNVIRWQRVPGTARFTDRSGEEPAPGLLLDPPLDATSHPANEGAEGAARGRQLSALGLG